MNDDRRLQGSIERQAARMRQADRVRPTLLGQTVYLGTLGLVLVLPVIGGAFLGRWLDQQLPGYSMHWTLSLLFLGLVVGGYSAYLMIRKHE